MRLLLILRLLLIAALTSPLVYYVGNMLIGQGKWPVWHWTLAATALVATAVAGIATIWCPPHRQTALTRGSEVLVRYCVAFLLIYFAVNKILPGQFILYNRDLDLSLRELPEFALAWHFLGHSALYNGFIAGLEFVAGVLLCWPRTELGGLLLTAGLTSNIVLIDVAFGIGAVATAIAAAMALAAFAMIAGRLDTLRPLIWRDSGATAAPGWWTRNDLLALGALALMISLSVRDGLAARRGLASQLPPAGRWEVVECSPDPSLAMCRPRMDGSRSVVYLEIGHWGEIVTDSERRSLEFSYNGASKDLEVKIQPTAIRVGAYPDDSAGAPNLILRGTVAEADTSVLLKASGPGVASFAVRLRRTHHAPWWPRAADGLVRLLRVR